MDSFEEKSYWVRASRKRLSRRRLLQLSGVGLAGVGLAACGTSSSGDSSKGQTAVTPAVSLPSAPAYSKLPGIAEMLTKYDYRNMPQSPNKPKMGGVLRWSGVPTTGLDFFTAPNPAQQSVVARVYNTLVKFKYGVKANNLKREIEGDLAESWDVAKDGSSYTFNLRKGVKFQNKPPVNGRELTAEDVKYCFELYKEKGYVRGYFKDVERFETPDKYTLKMVMKAPVAYILGSLAAPFAFIFPREVFEGPGLKDTAIGTGAFMLKEFKPADTAVLERNPNYFKKDAYGNQLPYIDRIEHTNIPDVAAQKAAFRIEQVDSYYNPSPDELQELLRTNPRASVQVLPQAPSVQLFLSPQTNKKPFDDVRIRRALSLAIDRQDNIDTGFGGAAVPTNFIPFDTMGYDWPPTIEQLGPWCKYDPKQAKQLLAEAGYPNGFKTKITHGLTSGPRLASLLGVQNDLKAAGIDAELEQLPAQTFDQQRWAGNWDQLIYEATTSSGFDLDSYTYEVYYSTASTNIWHYNDPEFDKQLIAQRRAVDPAERQKIALDIHKYLIDKLPRIPVAAPWKVWIIQPWLQNMADHLYAFAQYHGAAQQEAAWIEPEYQKK